ncbi:MAG: site-2 protease family protein, partial [Flavobacteriales bacterium]
SWEFRSKPAWQRLIVMVGGVTVNLILGMLIYSMVLFVWGRDFLPLSEVKYGVHPSEVMKAEGLQEGDRLLKLDGRTPKTLEELTKDILLTDARTLTIERNGVEHVVKLSPDVSEKILNAGEKELFGIRIPFIADTVLAGENAEAAGMKKNDVMLAVNGTDAKYFGDFRKAVGEHKGEEVTLKIERDGAPMAISVKVSEEGTIGIGNRNPEAYFEFGHETFSFGASIPAGISLAMKTLTGYVSSLKLLFSKAGASQIGGFGSIGSLFPSDWNWQAFWSLTAFLSIILAFMNLLPIPALDGGHVMFLLYEMVVGKPAPQRVMEVAQMVGMVLLLGLMLFANGNDLFKGLSN